MLVFKERADLDSWRAGEGPRWVRDRISLMNAICEHYFGRSIRVTSWFKSSPFHEEMEAFDVSRCSAGDKAAFRDRTWDDAAARVFELECLNRNIPLTVIYGGEAAEHWHVGDVATKVYQRG